MTRFFAIKSQALFGLLLSLLITTAHAELSLAEAEALALKNDPLIGGHRASAGALGEKAVADGQLPDPRIKLGLMNFPTDSFDRAQEPMTQLQVGVSQMFPRGDTLRYKSQVGRSMQRAHQARADAQALKARREVREAWFDAYYWREAGRLVAKNQALFKQLVNITRSRYAAGGRNQQDVIRAELELEMLADRELKILAKYDMARARLARWVGAERAGDTLPDKMPELADPPDFEVLTEALETHPMMRVKSESVAASDAKIAIAREAYKPAWSIDLTYADRSGDNMDGSARADFVSAMLMFELPLFTGKRQDKRLAAGELEKTAAMQARAARLLELRKSLDTHHAEWKRLSERERRYHVSLIPRARDNAEASLNAYQADRGDFTMLMRARITELDTQIRALKLRTDRAKAQAALLYLAGEDV